MAWFALVAFSGLLRPLQRSARLQPPRRARPDETIAPTMRLNAIELGLIAELSLEQARANEELANDAGQRPETQRRASESAMAWRERAQWFQVQARRQGQHPMTPDPWPIQSSYAGAERRRQMRRSQTRRAGREAADRVEQGNRRAGRDRRLAERRRAELARR
jgi:hypothetical protein